MVKSVCLCLANNATVFLIDHPQIQQHLTHGLQMTRTLQTLLEHLLVVSMNSTLMHQKQVMKFYLHLQRQCRLL